jgi:hypothetical protein
MFFWLCAMQKAKRPKKVFPEIILNILVWEGALIFQVLKCSSIVEPL